jgi:hypothetical protein
MLAFVASGIAYAVLLENRHTRVSIDQVNLLIKDCKVSKVYEIGSPSHRRPNRLRTIIELKDGQTLQTELGTHATVFKPAIDSVECPVSIATLEIT